MTIATAPELRFWQKAERVGDCLIWTSSLDNKGYGRFYPTRRQHVLAHRFAFELVNGSVPDGTVIRHACDNPPCINPEHLLAGTQLDNVRDRDDRGRTSRGRTHYRWRQFTVVEVADILDRLRQGTSVRVVAAIHHTRKPTIQAFARGERYADG